MDGPNANVAVPSDEESRSLPYYLENFKLIIHSIYHCSEFQHLFASDQESDLLKTVEKFDCLETGPQKLYVRLFLRKPVWLQRSKIKYEEFGSSTVVDSYLSILCKEGFLSEKIEEAAGLDELMPLLSLLQIRELAKQFRVESKSSTKTDIILELKRKCSQQKTPFGQPLNHIVCRNAVALLGEIYRLNDSFRKVFMRAISLIQLSAGISTVVGQNPIYGLLQLNLGKLTFPTFVVKISRTLFSSLLELDEFEHARSTIDEVFELTQSKNYQKIRSIYYVFLPKWESVVENKELTKRVSEWPPYLRKFSVGYQYTKILETGVEALEKLDEKSDAINGYLQLLEQDIYVLHHRGDWYNRLTILMLKIDKNPDAAAKMLLRGVRDDALRDHQRLELQERLSRISKRVQPDLLKGFNLDARLKKPVSVEICGKLCATENIGKGKTVFLRNSGETIVCSVEELALSHYSDQGYSEGVHSEGSLISSIYGILFWDIIYDESVLDVFRSTVQAAPLDLYCPSFWTSRLSLILSKLSDLHKSSPEEISVVAASVWNKYRETYSPAVNWQLFPSLEYLQGLLKCFTSKQLSAICERFAKNYGAVRAGFPDLTMWNPDSQLVRIIEVKGPNDRLSFKQMLWIDFLMSIDIPVEVCHVKASGAKRKSFQKEPD